MVFIAVKRIYVAMALVPLLFTASPGARAWGPLGHHTVGAIADAMLTDKAKQAVAALLTNDLNAQGEPSGRTTLAQVASWPDEIRPTPANRPTWHFDDAPSCAAFPPAPTWCQNGECASSKIIEMVAIMKDSNADLRSRNEALKWIVHLVGDVHQPLHAAENYYEGTRKDSRGNTADRGGNDVEVALSGIKTSGAKDLHGVWDSEFVALALGLPQSAKFPTPQIVAGLVGEARQASTAGQPLDWVRESNQLARSTAYNFPEFACYEPSTVTAVLNVAYIAHAKAVVHQKLVIAGARLANLLNAAFSQ
ncbi:MAG: S1/P1 nuclease [Paludibacterium sp.]|uniref:S1/P1 nuclease n=1 Tax=Paludibacterium sp. TaxID=1917523 RepID=UPI0025DBF20C|nr:S1/P1 nuclease [Paludibacterium sp.]MBV8048791.1 S1/P1 nuclease [Paludibacterium sp.]